MSDRERRTLQLKQRQMQPQPLTLREHIWALPTELIDIIHGYIYQGPLIPTGTNITVQQASYRVPAMLQLTSALRRRYREVYYTSNVFILPDFAMYQKWIADEQVGMQEVQNPVRIQGQVYPRRQRMEQTHHPS
ncbi:hypothetical protein Slin14017_G090920 [Septoria linicola]|nr:hypothetical protein Slin14017_G090920 [Septoria linicola]